MIRALFVLSLIVAAVSAFVTPVNHAAGEFKGGGLFLAAFPSTLSTQGKSVKSRSSMVL